MRATGLNEGTLRQRLGLGSSHFFRDLLPKLLETGVVQEVPYHGRNDQRRLRIAVQMTQIEEAIKQAGGKFNGFIRKVHQRGT